MKRLVAVLATILTTHIVGVPVSLGQETPVAKTATTEALSLATSLFDPFPTMLKLLPQEVNIPLGEVKEDTNWFDIPFEYAEPVRLKSPIKGEMLGIEAMPAGTTGFVARWTQQLGGLFCYFIRPNYNKVNYSSPQCYGAHPFRKERVSRVQTSSNIPLQYTYSTADSSIFRLPEHEVLTEPFDHSFKLALRIGGWDKKSVRLQWYSDDVFVTAYKLAIGADGKARLAVKGGELHLSQDPNNKKITHVEFVGML